MLSHQISAEISTYILKELSESAYNLPCRSTGRIHPARTPRYVMKLWGQSPPTASSKDEENWDLLRFVQDFFGTYTR